MGVTVNLKDAKMWQMKKSLYAFVKEMWSSYETAEFVDLWLLEYLSEWIIAHKEEWISLSFYLIIQSRLCPFPIL